MDRPLHYVVLSKGTSGDLAPMMALSLGLSRRGHDVTFMGHWDDGKVLSAAGIRSIPLDDEQECGRFKQDIPLLDTPAGTELFFRRHCLPSIQNEFQLISRECFGRQTVIVARHAATFADLLVAEALNVKLVRVFTAPSQIQLLPLVHYLLDKRFSAEIDGIRHHLGLEPTHKHISTFRQKITNIGAWPHLFAPDTQSAELNLHPVGFLVCDELDSGFLPPDILQLCEGTTPPVLISGSTAVGAAHAFYNLAATACHNLGLPFVLVAPHRDLIPGHLSGGIGVSQRLPFATLIPRVAAVIHHGGMGTMSRAIISEVPQIVMANGADRVDNAMRLSRLGLGKSIPKGAWSLQRLCLDLGQVISANDLIANCKAFNDKARQAEPIDLACTIIRDSASAQ